jgi:hypothetical protein
MSKPHASAWGWISFFRKSIPHLTMGAYPEKVFRFWAFRHGWRGLDTQENLSEKYETP